MILNVLYGICGLKNKLTQTNGGLKVRGQKEELEA